MSTIVSGLGGLTALTAALAARKVLLRLQRARRRPLRSAHADVDHLLDPTMQDPLIAGMPAGMTPTSSSSSLLDLGEDEANSSASVHAARTSSHLPPPRKPSLRPSFLLLLALILLSAALAVSCGMPHLAWACLALLPLLAWAFSASRRTQDLVLSLNSTLSSALSMSSEEALMPEPMQLLRADPQLNGFWVKVGQGSQTQQRGRRRERELTCRRALL
jgi:hypothetical protein